MLRVNRVRNYANTTEHVEYSSLEGLTDGQLKSLIKSCKIELQGRETQRFVRGLLRKAS